MNGDDGVITESFHFTKMCASTSAKSVYAPEERLTPESPDPPEPQEMWQCLLRPPEGSGDAEVSPVRSRDTGFLQELRRSLGFSCELRTCHIFSCELRR